MISVCIPTYNGEKFIRQQIESILCQLESTDEIIISDDSSTDSTIDILESFNSSQIKIYKNNRFYSPIFNLENALKFANGDYIFLSDQDDIWDKNKVNIVRDYLAKYDNVVSDCNIIDDNNNELVPSFFEFNKSKKGFINNIKHNSYLGCCMAFNRKILSASLPFPKYIAMHDIWIGAVTELVGDSIFINDKLVSYRKHSYNFSPTTQGESHFNFWFKIIYRIQIIYYSFLRILKLKLK